MQPPSSIGASDATEDGGTVLLQAVARVRERFLDAARALARRPEVRATRSAVDCRGYANGTTLEFYLEADVGGRTVCWWLDAARRESAWEVSGSVLENRDDREYQDQLREFPARLASAAESLAAELDAAAADLLATTELAEFLAPAV
jgi:hypothetical protein